MLISAEFRVSRNSSLRGSEPNGKVLREKMKFGGTANITTKETFHRSKASFQCKRHRKHRTKNNVFISRLCLFYLCHRLFFLHSSELGPPHHAGVCVPLLFRVGGRSRFGRVDRHCGTLGIWVGYFVLGIRSEPIFYVVNTQNRRFGGFFRGDQEIFFNLFWDQKSRGPLEKPLQIADFVFYCIKNGSKEFRAFFIFRGMVRNKITKFWVFFSSTKWFGTKFWAFFYLLRNGSELARFPIFYSGWNLSRLVPQFKWLDRRGIYTVSTLWANTFKGTPIGCSVHNCFHLKQGKMWARREIITVRGQSYFSRLPKYWPPIPFSARRVCTPRLCCGGRTDSPGSVYRKNLISYFMRENEEIRGKRLGQQRRWTWTGDFKCRVVKTGFCRNRAMQTGSSGTLIGWKSGQTTFVPLWDWMEGAWLRTL